MSQFSYALQAVLKATCAKMEKEVQSIGGDFRALCRAANIDRKEIASLGISGQALAETVAYNNLVQIEGWNGSVPQKEIDAYIKEKAQITGTAAMTKAKRQIAIAKRTSGYPKPREIQPMWYDKTRYKPCKMKDCYLWVCKPAAGTLVVNYLTQPFLSKQIGGRTIIPAGLLAKWQTTDPKKYQFIQQRKEEGFFEETSKKYPYILCGPAGEYRVISSYTYCTEFVKSDGSVIQETNAPMDWTKVKVAPLPNNYLYACFIPATVAGSDIKTVLGTGHKRDYQIDSDKTYGDDSEIINNPFLATVQGSGDYDYAFSPSRSNTNLGKGSFAIVSVFNDGRPQVPFTELTTKNIHIYTVLTGPAFARLFNLTGWQNCVYTEEELKKIKDSGKKVPPAMEQMCAKVMPKPTVNIGLSKPRPTTPNK